MRTTKEILSEAKLAKILMSAATDDRINTALGAMADALIENTDAMLTANEVDIRTAEGRISPVMIDRLRLTADRIAAMAAGIREIAALPSPLGRVTKRVERPNGLIIERVSVAMGVIAIIYESRPNVTSDAAALAIKSGSVCILRGGKEAYNSSRAIVDALECGLERAGLPKTAVQLIEDTSRESASELMRARGYVDLLIPRGYNSCAF